MKSKYHEHFLRAAQKLDDVTKSNNAIYQLALDISDSFDPQAIKKLCIKIQNISKTSNQEPVIEACKDLYLSLITMVGVERVQEITYKAQEDSDKAKERTLEELMTELNALIGLQKVKQKVTDLIAYKKVQSLRKQYNLKTASSTLHLAFIGNPGTGKTTVARIIGLIYKKLGILSKGHFTEVSRTDLIAGYQGQTALKVKKVVEQAKGGVLFIDEAYSITENDHSDSYGRECLTELTKALEDYRDDLVVIVAGYTEPMQKFFDSNPGLRSRFNTFIEFDDYDEEELLLILRQMCDKNDYTLTSEAEQRIKQRIKEGVINKNSNFSNGRFVRNLYDDFVLNQARRVSKIAFPTLQDLQEIREEDIVLMVR
ncbi:AAA family ATPase [uncultured Capnocytophaga sp.]|uniref:AAA family ATPase n=1 Tax=uncultured Capnocytophaga sp. TaxID=159273 RepID=UPI0026290D39|nr:AAA family ATPase [uncultured Capnocytophaga sp.]